VSGYAGAELTLHLDEPAPDRARLGWARMVARRRGGEPLQYAIGTWGFRRLELLVDRRVLIPRPETEQVVEVARGELRRLGARAPQVVDLGTGSGAIALSIALEVPGARVWGTDVSPDALAVARANLAGMGGRAAARVRCPTRCGGRCTWSCRTLRTSRTPRCSPPRSPIGSRAPPCAPARPAWRRSR
jgi:release factor glutamine methyltransferase